MPRSILFEVAPSQNGVPVTKRMSGVASSSATVQLDGKEWLPLIINWPVQSFTWFDGDQLTIADGSYGSLTFTLNDRWPNNEWSGFEWQGAKGRIWVGRDGDPFSSYVQIFEGQVNSLKRKGNKATLELLGPEAALTGNLLDETYAGGGGINGPDEIRGQLKPRAFGVCKDVPPREIDRVNLVYQVHGYGAVAAIPNVYDFAQALAPSVGNYASYDALIAATLEPGQWATCLADGLFRLGGPTTKKLSADVTALGGSTVGSLVPAILTIGQVPSDKIADFSAFNGASWNLYLTDQMTVLEAARTALLHAGGVLLPDGTGKWQPLDYYNPKSALTINADGSNVPQLADHEELPAARPIYSVRVGYDRCYNVHSTSDVSPVLLTAAGLFNLKGAVNAYLTANSITKTSGTNGAWDAGAYTAEGYTGDVQAAAQVNTAHNSFVALSTNPAGNANYDILTYAAYNNGGGFQVYELGNLVGTYGTIANGDILYTRRKGTTVEYGVQGEATPRHVTTGVSATTKLYFDTSLYQIGATLKLITFMPLPSDGAVGPQGPQGQQGASALSGVLSNESQTLPADSNGNVSSYAGASGNFIVYLGAANVTAGCTFAVTANPNSLGGSGISSSGAYSVTGGFGAASDTAYVDYTATHTPTGATITKRFSLAKSKAGPTGGAGPIGPTGGTGPTGPTGAAAKTLYVTSSSQTITVDPDGNLEPAGSAQNITFTAVKQNTAATVAWSVTDSAGNNHDASVHFTSQTGDTTTMPASNALAIINYPGTTSKSLKVTGTLSDGTTISDYISVVKLQRGANGATGQPGAPAVTFSVSRDSITIAADYLGNTKAGQLPVTIKATVMSGTTDVTASSSISRTANGSISESAFDASTGTSSIGTVNSAGYIDIGASYQGVSLGTKRVQVLRPQDSPPPQSQSSASTEFTGATTGPSLNILSQEVLLKANASGQISYSIACQYTVDSSSNIQHIGRVSIQLGYRSAGGSYSYTSAVQGSQATSPKDTLGIDPTPGGVSTNSTLSGLTPGATYGLVAAGYLSSGNSNIAYMQDGNLAVSQ